MRSRVEEFIAHYASEYYDPVKAREYYLRTRELKGRQPKLETDTQKEAWGYASNQITEKRAEEKKSAAEAQQAKLEQLQVKAKETQERIVKNLQDTLAKINKETPIPANASPKVRAFMEKQNRKRRISASNSAKGEMQRLSRGLKDALNKARDSYKDVQKNLDAKYKEARETEFENIRTKIT